MLQVVEDDYQPWSRERIDLQLDPGYLPCSEERSVLLQVGLARLGDTLSPVLVYLWRDDRNLFLRRQAELWKFGKSNHQMVLLL